jgi:hypothetical protein
LLWQHTLAAAAQLALKALTLDETFQPGTRSWTELTFGRTADGARANGLLWRSDAEVAIPGTEVRIQGSIDRLDLTGDGRAVRVSDYKTGAEPRRADEVMLGGGAELQRVIYAIAPRQLLPDNPRVVARVVFLGAEEPKSYRLADVNQVIVELAAHVRAAFVLLRQGSALPGPDAKEEHNDFRIALPASPTTYLQIKHAAFIRAFGEFARIWGCRCRHMTFGNHRAFERRSHGQAARRGSLIQNRPNLAGERDQHRRSHTCQATWKTDPVATRKLTRL